MNRNFAFASVVGAALLGSAATVQAANENKEPAAQAQPAAQSGGAMASDSFVTQQSMDQWRAPKLVGLGVYGPDGKKIGDIKDLMMDHDGKVQVVVLGVGGVLGLGAKDVGVPFTALRFQTDSKTAPAIEQPGSPAGAVTAAPPSQTTATRADPAAVEAHQGYPDKAMVSMTLDQLKSAPDFKYAPDPTASAENARPPATGAPPRSTTTP